MLEEQIAIRRLVDTWGRAFALSFFPEASEHVVACVYYGMPVGPAEARYIKFVLRERMAKEEMSHAVEAEIKRLRVGEAREGEGSL